MRNKDDGSTWMGVLVIGIAVVSFCAGCAFTNNGYSFRLIRQSNPEQQQ